MSSISPSSVPSSNSVPVVPAASNPASVERWMTELHALLRELETVASSNYTLPPLFSESVDNQLVQVRLGTASSLFAALQCRNAAIAGHSLRVALTCSAWARKMDLASELRDAVEIAALLHDIGAVAAPDSILLKPGPLSNEEAAVMARARKMSLEILRRSCRSPHVLEIIESIDAWYDGSREGFPNCGAQIPLGARMVAIVEAFDAMTTDHVYRPAWSQERAMTELFECAGSQFDPELVQQFADLRKEDAAALRWEVAQRWLRSLDPELVDSFWELNHVVPPPAEPSVNTMFQTKLLDNMYDAVVFIDAVGRITHWNHGAERLTGIDATAAHHRSWHPKLLDVADEKQQPITETDCPVHTALRGGVQSLRRLTIRGRGGQAVAVDAHSIPVIDHHGVTQGAIVVFHDASSEISLEQRCQILREKATKDPMTQLANRAELDRTYEMFITAHQQQRAPCSLLMCDLDRFKQINDTYGHQAGDDVIRCLAGLLRASCRSGDLVARYGGEEFVVLCADCGNVAAARRADEIRKALSRIPQPRMEGRSATVSFGVTELQPGDTPDTMLRRADRALLMAKAQGRNCVVQLGAGADDEKEEAAPKKGGMFSSTRPNEMLCQELVTPVPVKMAIEKLRGFIADHGAKVVVVDGNKVDLEIGDRQPGFLRRLTDRAASFHLHLHFEEERIEAQTHSDARDSVSYVRTRIRVTVTLCNSRDRRHGDVVKRAKQVLVSFRSYLMANEIEAEPLPGVLSRVGRAVSPWLTKPRSPK